MRKIISCPVKWDSSKYLKWYMLEAGNFKGDALRTCLNPQREKH